MKQRMYFIHGLGCPPSCETAQGIDAALGTSMTKLSYQAEGAWSDNWQSLLEQTKSADHNSIFIGESMGGFWAGQLSAHYHARCYLLNPAVAPAWQLRQFVGPFNAGGREVVITEEGVRSYMAAPDPRQTLNKGRVALMLCPDDTLINPLYTEVFYAGRTALTDHVADGHAITTPASFAVIASRVAAWAEESAFDYCLRRARAVTGYIAATF